MSSIDNPLQLHQVTTLNVTLNQSNEPQDSGVHMTTFTDAQTLPFVTEQEHVLNQTGNTTYNDQSMQLIQAQLQHKLYQVQLQLQKLNFLQQKHRLSPEETQILRQEQQCTGGSISQFTVPIPTITPGQTTEISHYSVQPTQYTQIYTSSHQPAFVQQPYGLNSQLRDVCYEPLKVAAYPTYNNRLKASKSETVPNEQQQTFVQQQCFTPSTSQCQGGSIQQPSISHSSAAVSNLQQSHRPSQSNIRPVDMHIPVVNACTNILQNTSTEMSTGFQQPSTQQTELPSYGSTALPPQSDTAEITSAGIQQPSSRQTVLPLYRSAALLQQSDIATNVSANIQQPTIYHAVLPSYSDTTLPPQTLPINTIGCNSSMASQTVNAGSTNACQATQVPNSLYARSNNVLSTVPTLNMPVSTQGVIR